MKWSAAPWVLVGLGVCVACTSGGRATPPESVAAATSADTTLETTFPLPPNFGAGSVGLGGDSAVVRMYGQVAFYGNVGGAWVPQGTIVNPGVPTDVYWADSVAVSGDDAVFSSWRGYFFAYHRSDGVWSNAATINFSLGATTGMPQVVAIDGDTAVETGYLDGTSLDVTYERAGVFTKSNGTWSQQAVIAAPLAPLQWNGNRPDAAVRGNTIAISVPAMSGAWELGRVFLFHREGTTWTLESTLGPPASSTGYIAYGHHVTLCDESTAVIASAGSWNPVRVYTRAGGTWTETAQLPTGGYFPALACDGQSLWICSTQCNRFVKTASAGWAQVDAIDIVYGAYSIGQSDLRQRVVASAGRLLVENVMYRVADPVDAGADAASNDDGGALEAGAWTSVDADGGDASIDDAASVADADDAGSAAIDADADDAGSAVLDTDDAGSAAIDADTDDASPAPAADDAAAVDLDAADEASDADADAAIAIAPSAASLAASPPRQRETPNAGWLPDDDAATATGARAVPSTARAPAGAPAADAPRVDETTGTSAGFECAASGPGKRAPSDVAPFACLSAIAIAATRRRRRAA